MESLVQTLSDHVRAEPFSLVATLIFFAAIVHTFMTPKFRHLAHKLEDEHAEVIKARKAARPSSSAPVEDADEEVCFWGHIFHFLGEIEAVFGIWVLALMGAMGVMVGWSETIEYLGHKVNYTEPMFVVVIMALASTRPVLELAESSLRRVASLGACSPGAWWLSILIIAPLLGSFITEPAAMTIAALLLGRQFYALHPSPRLAYATLGLLFVNISVGGTLTHFAAPPVLMVASTWKWDMAFMASHFGWRAVVGIIISTILIYLAFRKQFAELAIKSQHQPGSPMPGTGRRPVPFWISFIQLCFMGWTVFMAHHPALFIGGFLFFIAFAQATSNHQGRFELRTPMLVGFFLAGLVVHGGQQGWWIAPVLGRLSEWPLFIGAVILTAFNDNAAITYLATLVPDFSDSLKYAVVAGAVTGGGLTVIANAPNPAGQAILHRFFKNGISPLGLLLGALVPTFILGACFMLL